MPFIQNIILLITRFLNNWSIHPINVMCISVYGPFIEEVFVVQPPRFEVELAGADARQRDWGLKPPQENNYFI
jgi:hypothetical protein